MKHLICSFLLVVAGKAQAQFDSLKLDRLLKPLQNVDILHDDLSDLRAVGKAVGDARIVILGEQDHGDADAMQVKARLVRYLHEKKGFTVLAFESDCFSINDLQNNIAAKDYTDSLKAAVSSYWSQTAAMQPFWDYYASGNRKNKLKVTGFDIGLRTSYAKARFISTFTAALQKHKLQTSSAYITTLQKLLNGETAAAFTEAEKKQFLTDTEKLMQTVDENNSDHLLLLAVKHKALHTFIRNAREAGLTGNLQWLLTHRYPKEKVIVWTASYHAVKDIYEVVKLSERSTYYRNAVNKDSVETMTQMLRRTIKEPMYIMSTIAVSGKYTPTAWTSLKNAADTITYPSHAIEANVRDRKADRYFLDLTSLPADHPLQRPQTMVPVLHRPAYTAVYTKVYDGLLFIRNMKPLQ